MATFGMPILCIAWCSFIFLQLRFADAGYERAGSPSYTEAAELDFYGYGDPTEQRQLSQVEHGTATYLSEPGYMTNQGQTLPTPVGPSSNIEHSLGAVQHEEHYAAPPVNKSPKKKIKELLKNVLFIILSLWLISIGSSKMKGSAMLKDDKLEITPGKEFMFLFGLFGALLGRVLTVVAVVKFLIFLIRLAFSKYKEASIPLDRTENNVGPLGERYAPMGMHAESSLQ